MMVAVMTIISTTKIMTTTITAVMEPACLLERGHFEDSFGQQHGPQLAMVGRDRQQQLVVFVKREKVVHDYLSPAALDINTDVDLWYCNIHHYITQTELPQDSSHDSSDSDFTKLSLTGSDGSLHSPGMT